MAGPPELPISSRYRSTPQLAVGDTERAELNARLNTALTEGTVDEDEYRARLDQLYSAQTLGDLVPVVSGLPAPIADTPAIAASTGGRPGELAELRPPARRTLAMIGGLVAVPVVLLIVLVVLVVL